MSALQFLLDRLVLSLDWLIFYRLPIDLVKIKLLKVNLVCFGIAFNMCMLKMWINCSSEGALILAFWFAMFASVYFSLLMVFMIWGIEWLIEYDIKPKNDSETFE